MKKTLLLFFLAAAVLWTVPACRNGENESRPEDKPAEEKQAADQGRDMRDFDPEKPAPVPEGTPEY